MEYKKEPQTWETLPPYIYAAIAEVADHLTGDDDKEIAQLNGFLMQEGVLSIESRLDTSEPYVTSEKITANAIETTYYPELLEASRFVGAFAGCAEIGGADGKPHLAYKVQFEYEGSFVTVMADIQRATLELLSVEETVSEEEHALGEAFATLFVVDDPTYHQLVTNLSEVYHDDEAATDQAGRLRAIGVWSTELLAHPIHGTNPALASSLNVILAGCADDSCQYMTMGKAARYGINGDSLEITGAESVILPTLVTITGLRFIRNFDAEHPATYGEDKVILGEGKQPALVLFDADHNREIEMPLRYLELFCEAESWVPIRTMGQTCGELILQYTMREVFDDAPSMGAIAKLQADKSNLSMLASRRRRKLQ